MKLLTLLACTVGSAGAAHKTDPDPCSGFGLWPKPMECSSGSSGSTSLDKSSFTVKVAPEAAADPVVAAAIKRWWGELWVPVVRAHKDLVEPHLFGPNTEDTNNSSATHTHQRRRRRQRQQPPPPHLFNEQRKRHLEQSNANNQ